MNEQLLNEMKVMIESSKADVIQSLTQEIKGLREIIIALQSRVDELEKANNILSQKSSHLQEDTVKLVMDEVDERRRRDNNIVIFGLAERTFGTLDERKESDAQNVVRLHSALGLSHVKAVSFHRLGRANAEAKRPLLVKFETINDRNLVLRHSSSLRTNSEFRRVFVHPDLTRMQQENWRILRAELHRRRDGGEDVMIYKNQIVPRKNHTDFS